MSDSLTVSLTVDRTALDLDPLELDDPGTYEVVSVGPGARTWRRTTVQGRYQHGRRSVGEVLDTMTVAAVVRVYGSTWTEVSNRAETMIEALSQHTYTVIATIDDVVHEWTCEPADVSIVGGDTWQKHHAMSGMQEYQLSIPRDPIPLQGGM